MTPGDVHADDGRIIRRTSDPAHVVRAARQQIQKLLPLTRRADAVVRKAYARRFRFEALSRPARSTEYALIDPLKRNADRARLGQQRDADDGPVHAFIE